MFVQIGDRAFNLDQVTDVTLVERCGSVRLATKRKITLYLSNGREMVFEHEDYEDFMHWWDSRTYDQVYKVT